MNWPVAAMVAFAFMLQPVQGQDRHVTDMQSIADERQIIATVDAVGFYADRGDWDRVAEQFHPDGVVIDYSSYAQAAAGSLRPEPLAPSEVVARWQTVLPGYHYTQHLITNHQVEVSGDEALVWSSVHATHILREEGGEAHWIFLGDYEHHLVRTPAGWKIDRMTANMRAQLGDPGLPARAAERVKQGRTAATP